MKKRIGKKIGRRNIGRDDNSHAFRDDCVENPCHEHGVGDVVEVELVETEHTDSIDDVIQCHAHRAEFMRPRVQICKEPMKVNAPLADREPVVELVHEHRLPAADATPEIDPTPDLTARDPGLQCVEGFACRQLLFVQ